METSGLDGAKLIDFSEFAIKTLILVMLPAIFILVPLQAFAGGDVSHYNQQKLMKVSLGNVIDGSWVFWPHAIFVWYVVIVVEWMVLRYMATFETQRLKWLDAMPVPRSTTVLIERIPMQYRHDDALRELLESSYAGLFEGNIESVHVLKHTEGLVPFVEKLHRLELQLKEAKARLRSNDSADQEEVVAQLENQLEDTELELSLRRDTLLAQAAIPHQDLIKQGVLQKVYTESAFITFTDRSCASFAVASPFCIRSDQFVMMIPPHPSDIQYDDFFPSTTKRRVMATIGFALTGLYFLIHIPLVSMVDFFFSVQTMRKIDVIDAWLNDHDNIAQFAEAALSAWVLIAVMSAVPWVLMIIFCACFKMRARQWAQLTLQRAYFWFQMVFTVFVTCVEVNLIEYFWESALDPNQLLVTLAKNIPRSSHFYFSYILGQYLSHAWTLLRVSPTCKYLVLRVIFDDKDAIQLAEPEDQSCYGFGSRSARWSVSFAIALLFCTVSPVIIPLVLIEFLLGRVIYTYLLVFAESKKVDLGGEFFVQQLYFVQWSLFFFVVTMFSILKVRADNDGPAIFAFMSLLVVWEGQRRLGLFAWHVSPISSSKEDVYHAEAEFDLEWHDANDQLTYMQPELRMRKAA